MIDEVEAFSEAEFVATVNDFLDEVEFARQARGGKPRAPKKAATKKIAQRKKAAKKKPAAKRQIAKKPAKKVAKARKR